MCAFILFLQSNTCAEILFNKQNLMYACKAPHGRNFTGAERNKNND